MQEMFGHSIFGNTILSYPTALAIFIGGTEWLSFMYSSDTF
jgi:hypothetical protein